MAIHTLPATSDRVGCHGSGLALLPPCRTKPSRRVPVMRWATITAQALGSQGEASHPEHTDEGEDLGRRDLPGPSGRDHTWGPRNDFACGTNGEGEVILSADGDGGAPVRITATSTRVADARRVSHGASGNRSRNGSTSALPVWPMAPPRTRNHCPIDQGRPDRANCGIVRA
jgi:hypothetical protein